MEHTNMEILSPKKVLFAENGAWLDNFVYGVYAKTYIFFYKGSELEFYEEYIKKVPLAFHQEIPNFLLLSHEEFIADPIQCLSKIKQSISPEEPIAIGIFEAEYFLAKTQKVGLFDHYLLTLFNEFENKDLDAEWPHLRLYIEIVKEATANEYVRTLFPHTCNLRNWFDSEFMIDEYLEPESDYSDDS